MPVLHRPKLKICGLTTLADARYCAAAGADYLGFIQYPGSLRYVEPDTAKAIIEWLFGSDLVGVFVNETPAHVNETVALVGFTHAQLSGTEPPGACADVDVPVIKAIHVGPEDDAPALGRRMQAYAAHVDAFLLDTRKRGAWGGTGEPFDWSVAQALTRDFPVFLAGGISVANVEAAVHSVQPYGIDLASSVEAAPGRKDFDRLGAFFDTFDALFQPAPERSGPPS